jgi:hypothetical protein
MDRRSFVMASVSIALVFLVALAVLFGDPINRLSFRLSVISMHSMGWENGFWSLVRLPASAKLEDVALGYPGLGGAARVLELKKMWIMGSSSSDSIYGAVVATGNATKIIVFQYEGGAGEWSAREYDP